MQKAALITLGRFHHEGHLWLIAALLSIPAAVPYVCHYLFAQQGLVPTGFIQYDQPQYMAYARALFDGGGFQLLYPNPFSPEFDPPAIYFQTQTVFLGLLWRLTAWDPGLVYLVFGALATLACARVALALFAEVAPQDAWPRTLSLLVFFWGGGVLVVVGVGYSALHPESPGSVFRFDPFDGWWFLNFGRNLIFPTEAYYHALFFGSALAALRRRYVLSVVLALILTLSHNVSSAELLCIITTWTALEIFFFENKEIPKRFFVLLLGVLVIFFSYYLVLLPSYPEHAMISEQMKLPWTYEAQHFVPAYFLVGLLACWRCRRLALAKRVFSSSSNRLFLVWFVVAFALANHEFAMQPIQPLHFTRGYVWTPLFLLGAEPMGALFRHFLTRWRGVVGTTATLLVVGIFWIDNGVWLGRFPRALAAGQPILDVLLLKEEYEVLDWLSRAGSHEDLLLSENLMIGYMATVYSPVRSWQAHAFATQGFFQRGAELQALFRTGTFLPKWEGQQLLVVMSRETLGSGASDSLQRRHQGRLVFQNARLAVFRAGPGP